MTATHPQQEYIITEDDYEKIYHIEYHLTCEERRAICERSRPTPAPARDDLEQRFQTKREAWEQGYQDGSSAVQHDLNLIEDNAARQAREDMLDTIEEWRCTQDLTKGVLVFEIALGKKIESLRQAQPQEH